MGKYRNVRRRVKDRRQWLARRLDLLRAWRADLVVSEARRHRDRRPQHEVYYNRHRDLYYYSDLDPYSVLGLLSFSVFLFFVIFRFITNNAGGRSLEYRAVDLTEFISNKTTLML